jgi:hypothetical protein
MPNGEEHSPRHDDVRGISGTLPSRNDDEPNLGLDTIDG